MKPTFQFYLKDPNGQYYAALAGSNSVGTGSVKRPLQRAPIEWKSTDIQFLRNRKQHGVFRSLALSLTFVKDGAAILRYIKYSQGTEGKCFLEIERLNTTTQLYEFYQQSAINFQGNIDSRDSFKVSCEDDGLAATLKANEETPYEVIIEDADSEEVYMDGRGLRNTVRYNARSIMVPNQVEARTSSPAMDRSSSESKIIVDALATVIFDTASEDTLSQNQFFYRASVACTALIKVKGTYTSQYSQYNQLPSDAFKVGIIRRRGTTITRFEMYSDNIYGVNFKTHNIDAQVSIQVEPGDLLTLMAFVGPGTGPTVARYNLNTTNTVLTFSYDFRLAPSLARAYRYKVALQKLITQISPGAILVSDYLSNTTLYDYDTNPSRAFITCGESLRRIKNGKIKVRFEDFRKDLLGRFGCGIGIEGNTVRVEKLSYFYDSGAVSVPDLGEVKNLQLEDHTEYIHKNFEFGQKEKKYDDLNGRNEFNTTQAYATSAIRTKAEVDYKYIFRSDSYGIEFTRQLEVKETTDSDSDNDVFCIEVAPDKNSSQQWVLFRPQNDVNASVSGLIAPATAFNIGYSPKRCLFRCGSLVAVSTWKMTGTVLTFQTTDKNPLLVSRLGSNPTTITEAANVDTSQLPAPLFLPFLCRFETKTPVGLATLASLNPRGLVQYHNKGILQWGFIDEIGEHPADKSAYTFTILPAVGSPIGPGNFPTT